MFCPQAHGLVLKEALRSVWLQWACHGGLTTCFFHPASESRWPAVHWPGPERGAAPCVAAMGKSLWLISLPVHNSMEELLACRALARASKGMQPL